MQKHLGEHPDIFMASGEPSYFCTDYTKPRLTKKEYLDLFKEKDDFKIKGEKTVFYLPSKVALKKIADFNPEAKILVMLRNPIEAVYSFHSKMFSIGRESVKSFEKAWKLQEKRKKKKDKIYQGYLKPKVLNYGEVYKLGKHLKKVYNYFPKEQVKPILFDDFVGNEKETYKDVLNFLNLPVTDKNDLSKVNTNKEPKSKLINYLFSLRGFLPVKKLKKTLKIKGQIGFLSRIIKLNQRERERKPLSKETRKKLSIYFEDDIKLLSKIINKDLTFWLEK